MTDEIGNLRPNTTGAKPKLSAAELTFRRAESGDDHAIDEIDGSFTTDTILEVRGDENGFTLHETLVSPPIEKHFPQDEENDGHDRQEEEGDSVRFVCVDSVSGLCGFVDLEYEAWNRRLTIADIEVDSQHRGRGIGRHLLNLAREVATERGARTLWLEVTNINIPAIRAYRRLGFRFCGLDTSLYRGTWAGEDETAIYMSQDLTRDEV